MQKKNHRKKTNHLKRIVVIAGVLTLAALLLLIKAGGGNQVKATTIAGDLPAKQLDNALAEHRPTLAFFHSNTCQQCLMMIDIVAQVYPEFEDSVTLVDVNVYDEKNKDLIERVGLKYIPSLVFFDNLGQAEPYVGVMEAALLREKMMALAGDN